jgi:hypothetical protein
MNILKLRTQEFRSIFNSLNKFILCCLMFGNIIALLLAGVIDTDIIYTRGFFLSSVKCVILAGLLFVFAKNIIDVRFYVFFNVLSKVANFSLIIAKKAKTPPELCKSAKYTQLFLVLLFLSVALYELLDTGMSATFWLAMCFGLICLSALIDLLYNYRASWVQIKSLFWGILAPMSLYFFGSLAHLSTIEVCALYCMSAFFWLLPEIGVRDHLNNSVQLKGKSIFISGEFSKVEH